MKNELKGMLSYIDFTHVACSFLAKNDRNLLLCDEIQKRKLHQLGVEKIVENCHDPEKVIHNFSSHELSDAEKSFLSKGLNYAVAPDKANYSDHLVSFEKLYREIKGMEMNSETRELLKTKI